MNDNRRISQRDIRPQAVKFWASQYYDPKENAIDFKDDNGNSAFKIELNTGTITFGTNVRFDSAVVKGISPNSFVSETQLYLLSGGTTSGSTSSYYSDSTTWQNLDASKFTLNANNFPGCKIYLETVMRAGATGDSDRTVYADLYDLTTSATVTGSEISTSTKSTSDPGGLPLVRGTTNLKDNLTASSGNYIVRFKSSDAGLFVDIYTARLIIQFN
jgi:hypothetical protein